MIQSIIKRDGRVVLYDQNKIAAAILKALEASGDGNAADAARVANDVQLDLEGKFVGQSPNIEAVQDCVERQLMNHGFNAAAKAYILYRANRTRAREANTKLMKTIDEITNIDARISDMKRDNANIDGNTAMGSMLQIGAAGAKAYNEMYLLRPEHAKAYREGDIHIHDFDFYSLTTTCCQTDIIKLFQDGFSTGHGYLREPQSIQSYAALAAIAIQSNQNDQHGGQSIPNFDYGMALGVAKTYRKAFGRRLKDALEDLLDTELEQDVMFALVAKAESACGEKAKLENTPAFDDAIIRELMADYPINRAQAEKLLKKVKDRAFRKTDRDTGNVLAWEYGFSSVYHTNATIRRSKLGETIDLEITAVRIGDFAFVTAPYEMFGTHGVAIKAGSPYETTFVLSYCNGHYGYIPNTQSYDYGCYESHTSNFTRETGDKLVEAYISMLEQLNG